MAGIDRFLSRQLSEIIKKKIEPEVLKVVERKLFLSHGMSIKLSIEYFEKFLEILGKNSSLDVKRFQKDCINELIKIKKLDGKYSVVMINDKMSQFLIEQIGDSESRKIISSIFKNDLIIPDILKKSHVAKTSGYRKIENMILNGIIVETSRVLSESKKVSKFKCCFNDIKLSLNQEGVNVTLTLDKDMFEKSSCLNNLIVS